MESQVTQPVCPLERRDLSVGRRFILYDCLTLSHSIAFRFALDIPLDKSDSKYSPAFINVNVRPATNVKDERHKHPLLDQLKSTNQVLTERFGNFTHRFEVDGTANVCVRSASANLQHPQRFGLRVILEDRGPISQSNVVVQTHLGSIGLEMSRIGDTMKRVLSEADMAKDRDTAYHKQTQEMDQATIFWPVVQVCVLLMTGFAQASHIVRFFKSRMIF